MTLVKLYPKGYLASSLGLLPWKSSRHAVTKLAQGQQYPLLHLGERNPPRQAPPQQLPATLR